jgi:TonB-linked SusC/RagA family outer membrane protein
MMQKITKSFFVIILLLVGIFAKADEIDKVKLSVNYSNISVKEIFEDLRVKTGFNFLYKSADLNDAKKLSFNFSEVPLRKIVEYVSKECNINFKITGKAIVFKKKQKVNSKIKINGVVLDENGDPLPGVNVVVEHSVIGTVTDIDGNYELNLSSSNIGGDLSFTTMGYQPILREITGSEEVNISMKEDAIGLDEVVVVAFGKQKKESVIASVETVKPTDLKIPSSNLTTALAGRMSGMISYQRSGEPGADNAEFFIRGVTTFGYKTNPLILIDNVELSVNDLARLNTDDIESFSIMKDATATALYGARGANGVILVKTKEGAEGKVKINFRIENSMSMPTQELDISDPVTYMKLHNEATKTRDPLAVLPYSLSKIDNTIKGGNPYVYPANDWYRQLFNEYTMNQRANFSLSGGGNIARYYVAGMFSKDNGILNVDKKNNFNNNIDLKKYLLRSNVNVNLTSKTEMIVRLHMTMDTYQGPLDGGADLYKKVMHSNPVLFPAYYEPDEKHRAYNHILFGNTDKSVSINPYAEMTKGYKESNSSLMLAQLELKQDLDFIAEGLNFRMLFNTNRTSSFSAKRQYNPFYYNVGAYFPKEDRYILSAINAEQKNGVASYPLGGEDLNYTSGGNDVSSTQYLETALSYNRTFSDLHNVSSLLVFTLREKESNSGGSLQQSLPYRNVGLSGRFTYSYDTRYFGEFNFGYNGSERFSEKERFGFFPSAGIGWLVSGEKFWKNIEKVINKFKLKATYGIVGNDAIGSASDRFFYLSEVNLNNSNRGYKFGTEFGHSRNGVSVMRYANEDITWETAYKQNYGIELEFLKKFTFLGDLFYERRENILMERAFIPKTMGLSAVVKANVGEAKSRGFDCSLDFNHSFTPDFWISSRSNFTYATSEFIKYEEPRYDEQGLDYLVHDGKSLSQNWGYVAERLFIDDEDVANSPSQKFGGEEVLAGDIKYKDINNDGKISKLDQVPIGYPTTPEISYGFGISMGYKIVDFSCFFQGSARTSFFIDPSQISPFVDWGTGNTQLLTEIENDHWSEANPNPYAFWPRLSTKNHSNNNQTSTWWMRDGSFLRLKSVEIGVSLPESTCASLKIQKLRFYLSGSNLLTFSDFDMWDIEMGNKAFNYPVQKVFNLGLQLNF